MPTLISTEGVAMTWSPQLTVPVQSDYRLQEVIASVMRGIAEAQEGKGTVLGTDDLGTDEDDDE